MPQVDLETLVCCGGDGKVACETLIDGAPKPDPAKDDPFLPPESFQLPIDEEIDWVDRHAAVYERDDSTKGTTNPKSQTHLNSNPNPPVKLHSNSQHFSGSLKPKPPIIGLPKLHQSGYLGRSSRRIARQASGRIFPKKPGAHGGKSAVPEWEPGSPKVSCFGKVRSERERDRCRIPRLSENFQEEEERGGFWARFFGFSCCWEGGATEWDDEETERSRKKESSEKVKVGGETVAPELWGMKRFASGRRTASWGGDVDPGLEGHVELSGPLDPERIWGRRSVVSLEDANRNVDWKGACPTSV